MAEPCACGSDTPHADVADCVAALRRDRDALADVLDLMGARQRTVAARVEIDMSPSGGLVLYVTTSNATKDETLAALIVSQLAASRMFGRLMEKSKS